jgi:hypothetical protein
MSPDIRDIIALARNGQSQLAIESLRPLLRQGDGRSLKIAALAYCLEQKGDLPAALYLYGEALKLEPGNKGFVSHHKRCADACETAIAKARKSGGGAWGIVLGVILLLLGAVAFLAALQEFVREIVYDLTEINAGECLPYFLGGGAALCLAGSVAFLSGLRSRLRKRRAVAAATGPDFSSKQFAPCWACGLRRPARSGDCPYCAAPRKPPKEKKQGKAPVEKAATLSSSEAQTEGFEVVEVEKEQVADESGFEIVDDTQGKET